MNHLHATLWLDTEFNGWGGELISLALVDDNGREFYEVLACAEPQPWVAENVMPVLGKPPIPLAWLQLRLHKWLSPYDSVHVVADWPDDIAYLSRALITGPGERIDTPKLTMEIRRDLDAASAVPHNALEDARAMRRRYLEILAVGPRSVAAAVQTSAALHDIQRERRRQIEVEGWTPEHDDEHATGTMAIAAAAYAIAHAPPGRTRPGLTALANDLWRWVGWASTWWKPKDYRSNLVRAGALLVAEIERVDRAEATPHTAASARASADAEGGR